MEELENKYIELLLKECLNFKKSKSLFIEYNKINQRFVDKVIAEAQKMGINDIAIDCIDNDILKEKLLNTATEDMHSDPFFNKNLWNDYAQKDASFLMLETLVPHAFDGVPAEKITMANKINRSTREIFREKETTYQIPWCIAVLPNELWAYELFGKHEKAYEKLFNLLMQICMVDTKNPIESWNKYLEKTKELTTKLNQLQIKKMHYKNKLGTDLYIEMPDKVIWTSIADMAIKYDMIVNMPSYEIFSSPNYQKTNGIVYSSRPLIFAGALIDQFYLRFENGKVVDYDAQVGKDILKGIIESDPNASFLGEVALVNYNSPVSNTGLVFNSTLIDENASCHLALGEGFGECIENGLNMNKDQLLEKGINQSKNHVDFMIGTDDLEIEAQTKEGKILLFKKGNFNI